MATVGRIEWEWLSHGWRVRVVVEPPGSGRDRARQTRGRPDFGIVRGYFDLWVDIILERDHPDRFRLRGENEQRDGTWYRPAQRSAASQVLETVRRLNRRKTGSAAEMTSTTIRAIERELAK